ncbi:membrane protein [Sinorhizobium sp. GL2]|nr:membrane protein [Sinorhizobium sp. GL2]
MIRPDWTPATIALMVLGFVVFWPLGLAMLAYILFGEKLKTFKKDANDTVDGMCSAFKRGGRRSNWTHRTGNVAFDDWREAELARLEEERRKLDEMREEFDTYVRELRRAKDQEEFDRFMRDRKNGGSGPIVEAH